MELKFNLPANAGLKEIEKFSALSGRLQGIILAEGQLYLAGQERKETILKAMVEGESIETFIEDSRDVRHAVALYCESEENLIETYPLSLDKLVHFCKVAELTNSKIMSFSTKIVNVFSNQLDFSIKTLRRLIILYIQYFDRIECYKEFSQLIRDHLSILPENRRKAKDIECFYEKRDLIFSQDGPQNLAELAVRERETLSEIARKSFIPNSPQCRFYEITKYIYYIERLKDVPVGEDDKIFDELLRKEVKESPYRNGYIGHEVARIMIDRTLESSMSITDEWREKILSIMGDPRVPTRTENYQKWWGQMKDRQVGAMIKWLSGLDLKLFMQIIEEQAQIEEREDLLRMFLRRKRFLEGLYENEYIEFSRLMINSDVKRFLGIKYSSDKIPQYTHLIGEKEKSLIYLKIGDAHLLEGTHNFRVRISDEPPTTDLYAEEVHFKSIQPIPPNAESLIHSHSKYPDWQNKLLSILNKEPFNLKISPDIVLSKEDYILYREKYGMR